MRNKPKIVAFLNSYSQGLSGGDKVFLEIFKRTKNVNLIIVTSLLGKKLCQKNKIKAKYKITSTEKKFENIILTYFKRVVKSCKLNISLTKKDLLLSSSDALPDVLPAFFLKKKNNKVKWIQHMFHIINDPKRLSFWGQKISIYFIKKRADVIIADNSLLKKELISLGFKKNNIFVNHLGVNSKFFKLKPRHKKYEAVLVAQLRTSKGIYDLIPIWKQVVQKKPLAKLVVIGSGNKKIVSNLKSEITKNGLKKNINFFGFVTDKQLLETLSSSKVFIFPSHEEGFGLAALEAQATGLPVVAWDLPVFNKIFQQGMLKTKFEDYESFAKQVISLLNNKKLFRKLSIQAKENAYKFNWDNTYKKQAKIINRLIHI
ncbi:glycosyltransferase [Patescibacteria group bacterium]